MVPYRLTPRSRRRLAGAIPLALLAATLCAAAPAPPSRAAATPKSGTPSTTAAPARLPVAAKRAAPSAGAPARRPAAPALARTAALEQAKQARLSEESGLYQRACELLRSARRGLAPDADLELTLALDEARCGRLDSAAALLWTPRLDRALADTLPVTRRHFMPWIREEQWGNGSFDGWSWYVARARFEVAFAQRRWSEARRAAAACVGARPLAGADWLALALAAGKGGDDATATLAAERAAMLDPSLPEARYVAGIVAWRAGRRAEAQEHFRAAVALDSTERRPALAMMRVLLPGSRPDSLPSSFLRGAREVALLTSSAGPKLEEFVQFDTPARLIAPARVPLDSTWMVRMKRFEMYLPVLVDAQGRAVAHALPWLTEERIPAPAVAALVGSLPEWRFAPAIKSGVPRRSWVVIPYRLEQ